MLNTSSGLITAKRWSSIKNTYSLTGVCLTWKWMRAIYKVICCQILTFTHVHTGTHRYIYKHIGTQTQTQTDTRTRTHIHKQISVTFICTNLVIAQSWIIMIILWTKIQKRTYFFCFQKQNGWIRNKNRRIIM